MKAENELLEEGAKPFADPGTENGAVTNDEPDETVPGNDDDNGNDTHPTKPPVPKAQ